MLMLDAGELMIEKLRKREAGLRKWLTENAPDCVDEQAHLDIDTAERAYWHYGYALAVRDVLALLTGNASTRTH